MYYNSSCAWFLLSGPVKCDFDGHSGYLLASFIAAGTGPSKAGLATPFSTHDLQNFTASATGCSPEDGISDGCGMMGHTVNMDC